jgi:two-component system phosphate regulon sensor histidine kinase PhoR
VSLPILFLSVFEITRISKNEKELLIIYNKQLEAILFSINLHSEDIINSWASDINEIIDLSGNIDTTSISKFLSDAFQVQSVTFCSPQGANMRIFSNAAQNQELLKSNIEKIISDSAQKINRLTTYYRGGYRKIEPLGFNNEHSTTLSFFLAGDRNSPLLIILEIDAQTFIREQLGPKIQATAENRMNIGIVDKTSKHYIYRVGNISGVKDIQAFKPLWLFPQYNMCINLRDHDLSLLSKEKNRLTLFMILLVDLLFIVAGYLVFRNIRKEIRLTQIKSDFISNVSHEIRTPLALVSMYAETLEMDRIKDEKKKKEYYNVIFNETQRLSGIVNRILNFSKMESGKRTYSFSNFELNELVKRATDSYSFHLNNKGFQHKLELCPQPIPINGDTEAITDAFINLLDNAIKYSDFTKYIEIKTGIRDSFGFFEIRDKGLGIAKEHQKLIFEKFFRVTHGNLAHTAKGTGLGLTIVKNIVDSHMGKIEVDSKPGEGSLFRVLFPINS